MSRKHSKNSDLLAQLGEPLPLPYKPQSQLPKEEDSSDTILRHEPIRIISDPPLRRRIFSSGNSLPERQQARSELLPSPPPRIPLWRRKVSHEEDALTGTQAALNTIEAKVRELRDSCSNNEVADRKLEAKLRRIEQDLEKLIEESREASILEELERLQELSRGSIIERRPVLTLNQKLAIGIVTLCVFCAISFCLGHMSYEYCYYWC